MQTTFNNLKNEIRNQMNSEISVQKKADVVLRALNNMVYAYDRNNQTENLEEFLETVISSYKELTKKEKNSTLSKIKNRIIELYSIGLCSNLKNISQTYLKNEFALSQRDSIEIKSEDINFMGVNQQDPLNNNSIMMLGENDNTKIYSPSQKDLRYIRRKRILFAFSYFIVFIHLTISLIILFNGKI